MCIRDRAYKTRIDREREKVLDQLAREAQEQGMGYKREPVLSTRPFRAKCER